jgi:hypothetical protein
LHLKWKEIEMTDKWMLWGVMAGLLFAHGVALGQDPVVVIPEPEDGRPAVEVEVEEPRRTVDREVEEQRPVVPEDPVVPHPVPQERITAGWQEGRFFLESADGDFLVRPLLQLQMRYVANYRDDGGGSTDSGFEMRRARLALDGHAFGPDLKYLFILTNDRVGGTMRLLDAFATYHLGDGWHVRGGQFKDPVSHEFRVSTQRHWAVDLSLQSSLIGGGQQGYVQGMSVIYDPQRDWRAEVAVHQGYNSVNTGWEAGGGTPFIGVGPTDFGFSGRGEYMVFGDNWTQYADFTAMGITNDMLVIGAGADWSQAGSENVFFHTVDASWKTAEGLAVYGAIQAVYSDPDAGSFYDWGVLGQVGQMLSPRWEAFGRLGLTRLDRDRGFPRNSIPEFTIGANYYFRGHNAKLTFDGTWLPNGSPIPDPGTGVLAGRDDQFLLRAQVQLLF